MSNVMTKFTLCSEAENVSDFADLGHSVIPSQHEHRGLLCSLALLFLESLRKSSPCCLTCLLVTFQVGAAAVSAGPDFAQCSSYRNVKCVHCSGRAHPRASGTWRSVHVAGSLVWLPVAKLGSASHPCSRMSIAGCRGCTLVLLWDA